MDGRSSQFAFALPFPIGRALVVFGALHVEAAEVAASLSLLMADELHQPAVRPERWTERGASALDGRLPPLRPVDLERRRRRLCRQVMVADTPQGRTPVGLIHELGFWVLFPCESTGAA